MDYFRGLAILEVVLHHSSGAARRYAEDGSTVLLFLNILNRVLHFAVPGFLFLSAAVLTRSLLAKPDYKRYFWRRVVRGAWPYVLWTLLYLLWSAWLGDRPWNELLRPDKWQLWLGYGKGNYHLYFLLVALESYVLLPLLLPLARARIRISAALALGLAVQIGIYWANKYLVATQLPGVHGAVVSGPGGAGRGGGRALERISGLVEAAAQPGAAAHRRRAGRAPADGAGLSRRYAGESLAL